MNVHRFFSDADLESIREATAGAETRTGGEIVPFIVERVVEKDEARAAELCHTLDHAEVLHGDGSDAEALDHARRDVEAPRLQHQWRNREARSHIMRCPLGRIPKAAMGR